MKSFVKSPPSKKASSAIGNVLLNVALAVLAIGFAATAFANGKSGDSITSLIKAASTGGVSSNEDEYLKPDQAFAFSAQMAQPDAVTLKWLIADKYYLYRDRIKVKTDSNLVQLGAVQFPEGVIKQDDNFGPMVVYHHTLEATLPVARAANSNGTWQLKVTYQGCAEAGLCYNPITKTIALTLPPTSSAIALEGKSAATAARSDKNSATVSEQDRLATVIRDGSLLSVLATFFGIGALLSLTPCVLPMIPILSGIIVGQGEKVTPMRSFSLAFTYVQGMALTYAAAGAAFVLAFNQAPQAFFQKPPIVIAFALLFVILAFAMFGAFTLQMPSFLQTKLTDVSNQQKAGTWVGTFIMGALSALIVTACVAPAMIAALSVISQTHMIARGSAALYAMGLGMGLPLLLVGASAGSLLPRAGAWMDTVKSLFGVMFLGLAIYFLGNLLPAIVTMALWATLALLCGYWIFSLPGNGGKPASSVLRGVGLLVLVYGILLLIGASAGRTDPLQPLAGINIGNDAAATSATATQALPFKRIKSVADLNADVANAQANGKPIILDFYADWCTSCKEMEKLTFSNPQVRTLMSNAVLLQADVTANDADDQALLNRFGIFGPPSIMFFGKNGTELKNFRVVGYMPAAQFATHIQNAFAG